jgi:hypothetical protein
MTARETASNVPNLRWISAQTVRNRLRENDFRARRPYCGAVLRSQHRLARVRWCNRVTSWYLLSWRQFWFSEESRFMLQKRDGRTRVYRHWNETFARNCVLEVDNFGGGSVMMWGAISYAGNLNWCTSTATLTQLDTEMRFWHHTCCSQWTSVGQFYSTTTLGRAQLVLLLTF